MKIGDLVSIIRPAHHYNTYSEMAGIMKLKRWSSGRNLPNIRLARVAHLPVDHTRFKDQIMAIEFSNGDQHIMGLKAVEPIESEFSYQIALIAKEYRQ